MEALIVRQKEIVDKLKQIQANFRKDSSTRKTSDYIQTRLEAIDNLWGEFDQNNVQLQTAEDKSQQYFTENIYQQALDFYQALRDTFSSYVKDGAGYSQGKEEKATQLDSKVIELLSQQRTNFRALNRLIHSINTNEISEKWEIEDELRNLQARWNIIDSMHLQIDNILQGGDIFYEKELSNHESSYKRIKRILNQKLCSSAHVHQATPMLDIPVFTGKYTQWPTFYDLFVETIHNSSILSKTQKMQHLKGKVRGEAERLIQHLTISAENYDTAWDILIHRYNNPQLLFTKQIEIFLNQSNINKQTSFELKRLYDTSTECIHAIHNLGVDTSTWDPLLVHLLAKKLDMDTYSDYKEARKSPRDLPSLDEFMEFLEAKFIALEPIHRRERDYTPPKNSSSSQHYSKSLTNKQGQGKPFSKFYKAASTYTSKCPLCSFDHELFRCNKFVNMSAEMKLKTVAKHKICQNCLYKHVGKCFSDKRCKECHDEHNTLLHDAFAQSTHTATKSSNSVSLTPTISSSKINDKQHSVNHVASDDEEVLLTTLSLRVKAANGTFITLRALLDQGSQIALISENAAQMLGLQRQRYHATVSGIGNGSKASKGSVSIDCQSIYNNYSFTTQALVISRVINSLPNNSFSKQSWPHLQHIDLADPEYNVSKPIDILLDASIYSEIIMSGLIKGPSQAPIAQQTKLGWVLSGNVKTFNCHVVINNLQDIAKYWELEDISENSSTLTREEQYCEDFYQATTTRQDSGRYVVALPMKQGFDQSLGSSKPKAIAQFKQLEHKMSKNSTFFASYKQFIHEYQALGHMREAVSTDEPSCFLPHHGVLKLDSSTTKLRVVFNGSSKTTTGHSLNDLMECGPNLQVDLQDLILRWRQHKYVITADIEKMFRQILVRESDQPLQSIIWRDSPLEPFREYHLTTVTYGTKAAPFLAIRTLRQLAKDDASKYPLAAAALESSFFTDDLLSGHQSIKQTRELQDQLIQMLQGAGMNLRKWSANTKELVSNLSSDQVDTPFDFKCSESRKTLGLRWHPSTDNFSFVNSIEHTEVSHTKRQLLSNISKIFDPLGWLSPLTIKAKLLFQKAWTSGIAWDDKLSLQLQEEWLQLRNDLKNIDKFSIPRYIGNIQITFQIHGFCDASEKAYACSIYIVSNNNKGECTSTLVIAKTRLAPLNKQVSLPRLELCGAQLLSQLMKRVVQLLPKEHVSIHAWTDSMVALGWIHGDVMRWKQFVANRVHQIRDVIPASQWNHVRSEENPADSATIGSTVKTLLKHSLWWQGPKWLPTFDPNNFSDKKYQSPNIEAKQASVNTALCHDKHSTFISELLQNNNSITRVVRTIAWVSRFVARLRNKTSEHGQLLSPAEIENAYNIVTKCSQYQDFEDDLMYLTNKGHVRPSSKIASLCPYLDNYGIMRVGGRLNNSNLSSSAKHPIILSNHSRLTDLIISQGHITTLHGGPRLTLSYIREKYWILSGMNTVKRQIRMCVKCRRYSTEKRQQIMADLPSPRVTPSRAFTHTGVDFTGHVDLKTSKGRGVRCHKGYIAIFVCLSTKAVHLELVSDLSTAAFLAAFRRFCARRGTPTHMYSDNGTNFVGANRLLKKEYKEIASNINQEFFNSIVEWDIKWSFNSPAWPTAGGLWESAVKSFKHHLKRTLGEQRLTYEEFTTLIQQIEACLNSRPLFPLTENPEDDYLTPGHFLVGGSLLSRPQGDDSMSLPSRWQLIQSMLKHFWKRWSTDYLQQLQARSKWRTPSKNIDINDIVLIKDDNLPPGKWIMGRVHEVHPGKDGYVRVVSVKTQSNIIKRPITKLILLPVHEITSQQNKHSLQQDNQQNSDQDRTRKCRNKTIKSFFITTLMFFTMLFSPTVQQAQQPYNVTQITDNKGLYFDKISNLQYIRDEWKLVVYYNLSAYYQGLSNIESYVNNLKQSCTGLSQQYQTLTFQLEHELSEIQHYNKILQNQYRNRQKRGLVDGIGYIANSLFGVLDERFAEQYAKDIEQIAHNEKHLQNLMKNQTIVLEAEYNIIQRNEKIMNTQFKFVKEHLRNLSDEVNHVRLVVQKDTYVTSSALVANIIISNLRRMQETLINTITDIRHGRIDTHLLSPEQLQYQILTISSQLQGDLTMPVEQTNFVDIYKMLKVSSRLFSSYLIIEIKIPLVSKEVYELDRIISIPQNKNQQTYYIIPSHPYIAFNLRKDTAMFLSDDDLHLCLHATEDKILCSLNTPIYDMKLKQSICQLNISNVYTKTTTCRYEQSSCANRWIKLHARNDWLFSCCQECSVRIFCTAGISMSSLSGNGLVTLEHGCVLKDNDLSIYTHNNYMNHMAVQNNIKVPELSILNNIINTTITDDVIIPENHTYMWKQLKDQIEDLKGQSYSDLNIHDVHHYTTTYVIIAVLLLVASTLAYFKIRRCRQARARPAAAAGAPPPPPRSAAGSVADLVSVTSVPNEFNLLRKSVSCVSVDRGTSPMTPIASRSVSFHVPSVESRE